MAIIITDMDSAVCGRAFGSSAVGVLAARMSSTECVDRGVLGDGEKETANGGREEKDDLSEAERGRAGGYLGWWEPPPPD